MPLHEPTFEVLAADDQYGGLPVVIGIPFLRGTARDESSLALVAPSGRILPFALRSIAAWPDTSIRWGLLAFQAAEKGSHRIDLSAAAGEPTAADHSVLLTRSDEQMTLDNGLVRVVLDTTGPGPVREITALGHTYLAAAENLRFTVNEADTTREQKRTCRIMESSPVRTRVRVSGAHFDASGQRLLNYRLDIEMWAGLPALRMDYHFFHLEPGREEIEIKRMALEWDVALDAETQRHFLQHNYGLNFVPRDVFNPAPVAIVADELCGAPHVEHPAMLLDDTQYPRHLRPPLIATRDWLGVGDGTRSLYMHMQDFTYMRPKRLACDGAKVEMEFWPAAQGTLSLPQGRSRRQVVTVAFGDQPRLDSHQVERLLNGPLHEGRAVIDPAWLRHTGEFDTDRAITPGANVRFEKYIRRLVNLSMPQDMFDLGDTIDSGYSRTYIPIANNPTLRPNAPAMPRVYQASLHNPLIDWALPQLYEPVWTNNEYDAIHTLCSEIMRAGRADLWTLARWAVRHNIEVDFTHYHDDLQQNRGSPQHSCGHNRSGSIPSHYWTQGLLEYYCMTGDPDVLEIAVALGDKIIEDFTVPELRESFWAFTRELGWPSVALAHLYDITGEQRFLQQLEEIVDFFISYEHQTDSTGLAAAARGNLSVQSAWSMIEGTDRYQRLTGRDDVKAWLIEKCEGMRHAAEIQGQAEGLGWAGFVQYLSMSIGYEQTGDRRFLQIGMMTLDELVDSKSWSSPVPEAKPMAVMYRGLSRLLFHTQQAGLLDRLDYPSVRDDQI